jgi:hypothetical protein
MNQTLEERERYWYVQGWALPATSADVDLALAAKGWVNAAGDHYLNTPAELTAALEAAQTDKLRAEAFEEALHSLTLCADVPDEVASIIAKFLKDPHGSNFDRMLEGA